MGPTVPAPALVRPPTAFPQPGTELVPYGREPELAAMTETQPEPSRPAPAPDGRSIWARVLRRGKREKDKTSQRAADSAT